MTEASSAADMNSIVNDLLTKTGYLDVFAILNIARSAHLSRIAKLIGKTKSTVLKTIESMLNEVHSLIEIDGERTLNTKGVKKFYRLSAIGSQVDLLIDQTITDAHLDSLQRSDLRTITNREEYREQILNEAAGLLKNFPESMLRAYFTLGSELNFYFQRASTQSYLELAKRAGSEKTRNTIGHVPFGTLFSSLKRIQVSSPDQVARIIGLTSIFFDDLKDLEATILKENEKKIEDGIITVDDLDSQIVFVNLNPIIEE